MPELPRCVYCWKPTLMRICTWFASGPVVIGGEVVRGGVNAPCCFDCHAEHGPRDDKIHWIVF